MKFCYKTWSIFGKTFTKNVPFENSAKILLVGKISLNLPVSHLDISNFYLNEQQFHLTSIAVLKNKHQKLSKQY